MKDESGARRTKDATELKGLGDLRTAISTKVRSMPDQGGKEYLDLYLAGNEKKRLAKLSRTWEKQEERTNRRRIAVSESIAKLEEKVGLATSRGQGPLTDPSVGEGQPKAPDYTRRQWKTMPLEY